MAASAAGAPYFGKTEAPQGQTLRYISGSEPELLDLQFAALGENARLDYTGWPLRCAVSACRQVKPSLVENRPRHFARCIRISAREPDIDNVSAGETPDLKQHHLDPPSN